MPGSKPLPNVKPGGTRWLSILILWSYTMAARTIISGLFKICIHGFRPAILCGSVWVPCAFHHRSKQSFRKGFRILKSYTRSSSKGLTEKCAILSRCGSSCTVKLSHASGTMRRIQSYTCAWKMMKSGEKPWALSPLMSAACHTCWI